MFNDNEPLILAHRGLVTEVQENTQEAVRRAVDNPFCDGAEVDVFLTKDQKVVLCHDENLKRLTGIDLNIWDINWEDLKQVSIKQDLEVDGGLRHYESSQPFVLLQDVLNDIHGGDFLLNIEMKANFPSWKRRKTGTEVAKVIKMTETEGQVISTSFDFFMLYMLEKEYGTINSGFAYDDDMPLPKKLLKWILERNIVGNFIHSTVVDLEHTLIDDDTIKKFHDKDIRVGAYTLYPLQASDTDDKLQDTFHGGLSYRLANMGVDWIETDQPERVYEAILKGR